MTKKTSKSNQYRNNNLIGNLERIREGKELNLNSEQISTTFNAHGIAMSVDQVNAGFTLIGSPICDKALPAQAIQSTADFNKLFIDEESVATEKA